MRGILATFLHDHPQEKMIDDTTKKERSIVRSFHHSRLLPSLAHLFNPRLFLQIETLYNRSTQLTNASHKDSGVHDLVPVDPSTESHAQTLLGLAASSATSPQANGHQPLPINSVPSPSDLANYQNRSSFYGQNQSAASSSSGMATSPHWAHLLPAGQANGNAAQGGRMASTPPSLEDESAQALLDQWCQEVSFFLCSPFARSRKLTGRVFPFFSSVLPSFSEPRPRYSGKSTLSPSSLPPFSQKSSLINPFASFNRPVPPNRSSLPQLSTNLSSPRPTSRGQPATTILELRSEVWEEEFLSLRLEWDWEDFRRLELRWEEEEEEPEEEPLLVNRDRGILTTGRV